MAADITQELALLNQQAAELLQKYNLAFDRLDQKSQELATQLANQVQTYLQQLQNTTDDGLLQLATKIQDGLAQLKAIIDAANVPIVVELPSVAGSAQVATGYPVSYSFSSKALLNGAVIDHFIVDWGDGTSETVPATNNIASANHTFQGQAGGSYTISVIAVDNFGNKSPAKLFKVSLVDNAPPTQPIVNAPQYPVSGSFTMTISGSTDPEGQTVTYSILNIPQGFVFSKTQGITDNEPITAQVPSVTQNTTYTFDVVAVDALGATSQPVTVSVTVAPTTPDKFVYFQSDVALVGDSVYNELITVQDGIVLFTNTNPVRVYKFDFGLNPVKAKEITLVNPSVSYQIYTDGTKIYLTAKSANATNNIGKLYIITFDKDLNVLAEDTFNIPATTQYFPSLTQLPDGSFVVKFLDTETFGTATKTIPRFLHLDSSLLKVDEFYIYNNQAGYEAFSVYDLDVDANGNIYGVGELFANNGVTGSLHGVVFKLDQLLSLSVYLAVQRATQDCNTKTWAMKHANGKLYFTGMHGCGSYFWFGEVDATTMQLLNYFDPALSSTNISASDTRSKPGHIEVIGNKVYALYSLRKDINANGTSDENVAILEYDITTSQVTKLYTIAVKKNTNYWATAGITQVNGFPVVWLSEGSQKIDHIVGYLPDTVSDIDLLAPVEVNVRNINTAGLANETLYHATLALTKVSSNTVTKVTESAIFQIVDIPLPNVTPFSIYANTV